VLIGQTAGKIGHDIRNPLSSNIKIRAECDGALKKTS
jgi:hypothetical protein